MLTLLVEETPTNSAHQSSLTKAISKKEMVRLSHPRDSYKLINNIPSYSICGSWSGEGIKGCMGY